MAVWAETNLGPLTTTFSPPATCFYTTAFPMSDGSDATGAGLAIASTSIVSNPATACYPSAYENGDSSNYFSPGLCPSGYTLGAISTIDVETRGICCPSGFTSTSFAGCSKHLTGALTASAVLLRTTAGLEFYLHSTSTQWNSPYLGFVTAAGIPVRWRAGDFTTPPAVSSTSPAAPATTTGLTSSTSPTTTPTSPASSDSGSGGYSTSDKIALGVGIGVGIPGALAGCVKLWSTWSKWRKRRSSS